MDEGAGIHEGRRVVVGVGQQGGVVTVGVVCAVQRDGHGERGGFGESGLVGGLGLVWSGLAAVTGGLWRSESWSVQKGCSGVERRQRQGLQYGGGHRDGTARDQLLVGRDKCVVHPRYPKQSCVHLAACQHARHNEEHQEQFNEPWPDLRVGRFLWLLYPP